GSSETPTVPLTRADARRRWCASWRSARLPPAILTEVPMRLIGLVLLLAAGPHSRATRSRGAADGEDYPHWVHECLKPRTCKTSDLDLFRGDAWARLGRGAEPLYRMALGRGDGGAPA